MKSLRYEIKMTCNDLLLPQVRAWVNMHPEAFIVSYPPRQVNSLYFDTMEAGCLNDNLIGISERTKLRFRWYGNDYSRVKGHLELKGKTNQLGWKERFPIPVTFDLETITWPDLIDQLCENASESFAMWLSSLRQPTLLNGYHREYYESRDHDIRVTLDSNLVAYEQFMNLSPNLTTQVPTPDHAVIEVKADPALYRRLSDTLSGFPLQVSRNSKYVNSVLDSSCFL